MLLDDNNEQVVDLDLKIDFNGLNLSLRQIHDWEARHRQFCKNVHRQPCECTPWDR